MLPTSQPAISQRPRLQESVKNLNFSDCTMYEEVDRRFVVAPNTTRIMNTSGENVAIVSDATIALRHVKGAYPPADLGPSFVLNMPLYMLLQGLEIRINPEQANKAHGLSILVGVEETNEMFNVRISNAVMLSLPITDMNARPGSTASFTDKIRSDLIATLVTGNSSLVSVTGDVDTLKKFASCISTDEDAT
ncbi:hypothetical protein SARC_12470 [Sphaeroforma arctica JP610]|uniref:Alkyl sulfatase C-terminal domain-containing protein n=1 Tax=Sphaeroforma arctica JP610 TaxID=667725 RepID=A0A0L0FEU5_9EUKA|nr:hypothetical protein SARC_12470 [Sphaeroforma arctica JP610]KNC74996.1 hypothetical protein SARC_12470 [Sphaeroforma arctica JP610]|eukprot:XP_014148898.1 hypothetical protein SARC_12470 [Sphaeroforma arctica JP610]